VARSNRAIFLWFKLVVPSVRLNPRLRFCDGATCHRLLFRDWRPKSKSVADALLGRYSAMSTVALVGWLRQLSQDWFMTPLMAATF
jgi:hypothetical protein